MSKKKKKKNKKPHLLSSLFKAHPWHGIPIGENSPSLITAYIEIVPTDTVKYELDKESGLLKVDRPQRLSSVCPMLYGLVPQTYCGTRVGDYCAQKTGETSIEGDKDPLDICVLTERPISHGEIILQARPIGGFRMIDGDEADDKIIAVLSNDELYGGWRDIDDLPATLLQRLRHYFLTYKDIPGESDKPTCRITHAYNRLEAEEVIQRSHADYLEEYGDLNEKLHELV